MMSVNAMFTMIQFRKIGRTLYIHVFPLVLIDNNENMFETDVVRRANEVNHSARSGGIIGIFFSIFFNMKDSNEYTQHTNINIIKKITLNHSKYNYVCSYGNFS